MPTIDNDIVIDRPPAEAWVILGDLTGVRRWVPGVAAARWKG
jgi:carbon monoxide dehydrogenase subunit G